MKTSVVLLALATAALAAPALHEETFEDVHHNPAKFQDAFTRERKSTFESGSSPSPGSPVNLASPQVSEFGVSGRTFNLKKPIIIQKKNIGSTYQVYRNSDEEKLDSPEGCRKQVRVNLCDEQSVIKSADMMRNSAIEDPNQPIRTTEDDMKHSIKLAKEAVENLQKDMDKKIEHTPLKSTPWKHGDSESDAELHQDIEEARQALEHIQNNFDELETSNTQTTLKDAEIVGDVAFPREKTEEERLAQWKDVIENIQRNVELARNIEESFKSTHDGKPHSKETSMKDFNKHEQIAKEDIRITGNEEVKKHEPTMDDLVHSKREKSNEHEEMKTDLAQKDMLESASMVSSSKLQKLHHSDKAKDADEKPQHEKGAVDLTTLNNFSRNMDINTLALKVAKEVKESQTETNVEKNEKNTGLAESLPKNQRDTDTEHHDTSTHMTFKHDKNIGETEDKMIERKSAEHITDKNGKLIKDGGITQGEHNAMKQMKQASDFAIAGNKQNTQFLTKMKTHENMVHKDLIEGKAALPENSMMPAIMSDSLAIDQHKAMMRHPEFKSVEDSKNMQHQFDQSHMRWAQAKQFNSETGFIKSATETDHLHKMHDGHHHIHQHANPHHFNAPNHEHLRQNEHFMAHSKSADMDNPMQSNYFMNRRDSDNMGQEGPRFQWMPAHRHHHESARSVYGAPASAPANAAAGGAVGLFPNANVGSCGIPLLLSCNPSVVSGSLAKAHPAPYTAPAYRTEDDFNIHSKRDVKKTEKLVDTLNRTPNNILKTSSVLVAKH